MHIIYICNLCRSPLLLHTIHVPILPKGFRALNLVFYAFYVPFLLQGLPCPFQILAKALQMRDRDLLTY